MTEEGDLKKSVLEYLAIREKQGRCYCFPVGSGAIPTADGRYFKSGRAGVPDVICVIDARFYGLELKSKKGKCSPAQQDAARAITGCGGEYRIIRSIDEVMKIV